MLHKMVVNSNTYCSEYCFADGRSVFDEDYRGKAVYANPTFNLLFPFVVHYLITKVMDAGTSGVFNVPVWSSTLGGFAGGKRSVICSLLLRLQMVVPRGW